MQKHCFPWEWAEYIKKKLNQAFFSEGGWYEKGIKISLLPSFHRHRRSVFDYKKVLWGSFLIQFKSTNIFFAGDTAYSDFFSEIRKTVGNIEIAILPIGSYKPEFMMEKSHLNPFEAVKAANKLGSKIMAPMHYGTYDLTDEPRGEPLKLLKKASKALDSDLKILNPGTDFLLNVQTDT